MVGVALVHRVSTPPKIAGRYQSELTDDPALTRWRRDADGRSRLTFFTSRNRSAPAEIKKDDTELQLSNERSTRDARRASEALFRVSGPFNTPSAARAEEVQRLPDRHGVRAGVAAGTDEGPRTLRAPAHFAHRWLTGTLNGEVQCRMANTNFLDRCTCSLARCVAILTVRFVKVISSKRMSRIGLY